MNAQLLSFPNHASLSFEERVMRLIDIIAASGRSKQAFSPAARAVAALCCALGLDRDPRGFAESLPQDDPFTLDSAMHTCIHLGYKVYLHDLHAGELDIRLLPCMFMDKDERIITLIECVDEGIIAYDATADAHVTLTTKQIGHGRFLCTRIETQQQRTTEKAAKKVSGQGWLRAMLGHFREHFTQLFAVSFMLGLVALSTPILIMLVYDRVIGVHATGDLSYLAVGFGLALLVEAALRFMRARHLAWLGTRIDVTSTHAIITRLLHLPASMIERASVASQIARIKSFEEIRDFFTGPLFLTLLEMPFTLLMIAVLGLIAGNLVLIPIVAVALYGLIFLALRPYTRRIMFRAAKSHSELQKATLETFKSMEALRASGMQDAWHLHTRDLSAEASYRMFRSSFFSACLENVAYAITAFAGLLTLYLGVERVLAGTLTSGALIASLMLSWRILTPIAMLCTMLPRLEQLKQTAAQLNRLMDIAPEPYRTVSAADAIQGAGMVEVSNVGIRYNRESEPVFAGLTFQARPGMLVGIMGGNGCGKSTLLKLIMGLYQPQAGTIRLDGTDIRQFTASELRRNFAYVPQNPDFFTGTIAENLRIANPTTSDDDLRKALIDAGIWGEVDKLPHGLNTFLDCSDSEGSPTLLSYRLNLARACLSPGKIVLCDELPYALLNDQYGDHYRTLLRRWQGNRTAFFVTHREDFIAIADLVIGLRRSGPPLIGAPNAVLAKMKEESYETISARAR